MQQGELQDWRDVYVVTRSWQSQTVLERPGCHLLHSIHSQVAGNSVSGTRVTAEWYCCRLGLALIHSTDGCTSNNRLQHLSTLEFLILAGYEIESWLKHKHFV